MRCGSRPDATWNSVSRICARRTARWPHGFASRAPLRCTGVCTAWGSAGARCCSSKSIGGIAPPACRRGFGRLRKPSACRCTTEIDRARKAFSTLGPASGPRRKPPPCARFSRPAATGRPPRCFGAVPWNTCAAWAAILCVMLRNCRCFWPRACLRRADRSKSLRNFAFGLRKTTGRTMGTFAGISDGWGCARFPLGPRFECTCVRCRRRWNSCRRNRRIALHFTGFFTYL